MAFQFHFNFINDRVIFEKLRFKTVFLCATASN